MLGCLLADCTVGPDYARAPAPVSPTFKELKGWKVATPSDALDRGDWWAPYKDPKLALLLQQIEVSNQTVAAAAAAYEQSRAVIREAQAALFPIVSNNYTATRTRVGPKAGGGGNTVYTTTYTNQTPASWDLDVWGKVRRQIESNESAAQASAADLDNAKLSAQAQLAAAYFNLRAADSLRALLLRTAVAYRRTLNIVRNQFKQGYQATEADVATAEAQVLTIEAQAIAVSVQRAQFEHAIAMLIGRPPAELTVAPHTLGGAIPRIPVVVPSTLLERRPDIAAMERIMEQQNALIGVAVAAYYPDISLSGLLEFTSNHNPLPFSAPFMIWSLGVSATETLFDGGLRGAQVDAARAVYWQSVANYRQTVLTAFQQVEDQLAAIRLYTQQLAVQQRAVTDARRAVEIYLNQYRAGTVAFTTVVTAEAAQLNAEESELTIRQNLYLASVNLITALGGGWDANLLPTQKELSKGFSLLPQL